MDIINITKTIEYFNNSAYDYFWALIIFFTVLLGLKFFKSIVIGRILRIAKKTSSNIDDIVIESINVVHWPIYVLLSLEFAIKTLNVPQILSQVVYYLLLISVVYYLIKFAEKLIDFGATKLIEKKRKRAMGLK